jgi:hypothetical protein
LKILCLGPQDAKRRKIAIFQFGVFYEKIFDHLGGPSQNFVYGILQIKYPDLL